MKVSTVIATAASLSGFSSAITVSYDTGYDDAGRSLTAVACSDGQNGLITRKGWQKQGDIPNFPFIGGAEAVAGWNSPNCGKCFQLSYRGNTINVLAIDHAVGFNIGKQAMDRLTNNQAAQLGRIDAQAVEVAPSVCKF